MKTKYLFAALLALGALTACNNDDEFKNSDDTTVEEGIPTTATISINVSNPSTRAPQTRAESKDHEKTINLVDILIFDRVGVLEVVEKDITPTDNNKTKSIHVTTGLKTIYAIVNNNAETANIALPAVGSTLAAFEEMIFTAAEADNTNSTVIMSKIARDNHFVMIGHTEATLDAKSDPATNEVTINVSRAAAKAQALFKDVKASDKFEPAVAQNAITFSDAYTALAQQQPIMFIEGQGSHYSTAAVLPFPTAYNNNNYDPDSNPHGNWKPARTSDFDKDNGPSGKLSNYQYSHFTPENWQQEPKVNNVTCMLFKIKSTPSAFSNSGGTLNSDGTFYVIAKFKYANTETEDGKEQNYTNFDSYYGLYSTKEAADAVLAAGGALNSENAYYKVLEYKDGLSYYRVNLRDMTKQGNGYQATDRYAVLRNNFFKVTINEINNIGWNNPEELVDPDNNDPIETETSLTCTIAVEDWVDVNQNEDLH